MKKLFEGGFVSRDKSARPYRYAITEKGKERVGSSGGNVVYAVSQ
jgi:predicted transcriptional regulator